MLRTAVSRSSVRASSGVVRSAGGAQKRQAHAISNPTLANIEKRWETLPPQEQADLWMALRDRMKVNWAELTLQEKKAGLSPFFSLPLPCLRNRLHGSLRLV
jgi:cytochrome c oxidase subunit 4